MAERKEFKSFNPEERQNYKYAILQPYFDLLPPSIIETMLDFDLFERDEHGNIIQSTYETRIQTGEVEEVIKNTKPPIEKTNSNNL